MILLAAFLILLLLYGLVSKVVNRSVLTAPIIFTVAGAVIILTMPDLQAGEFVGQQAFLRIAEVGLVLLLFSDASSIGLHLLKRVRNLPIRLLSTGMLLTIGLGAVAGMIVFPGLSAWEAGILAAILAPTDAGLGQVIVTSKLVPSAVRNALNVEAGLNDGLSVPFLLFFIALAGTTAGQEQAQLWPFIVSQLGYGVLVGVGVGGLGGILMGAAHRRQWMTSAWQRLAVVTLPLLAMVASEAVGASMFIAAFVAGMAVQIGFRDAVKESIAFAEEWGQLFNLSVFFLFGIIVVHNASDFTMQHVAYAILSLTLIRIVPVAVALIGTRMQWSTVLFMGWFGPRGLASIVLGLVYLEQQEYLAPNATVRLTVIVTVLISIVVHGLTARPGTQWYARRMAALAADAPEHGSEAA